MSNEKTPLADLLAQYKSKDDEVSRAKDLLALAMKERSDAVKTLHEQYGKGPYEFKGVFLGKIVIRPTDDNTTYFFRGNGSAALKVD